LVCGTKSHKAPVATGLVYRLDIDPKHFGKLNPELDPTSNSAAANQKLSKTERSFEN